MRTINSTKRKISKAIFCGLLFLSLTGCQFLSLFGSDGSTPPTLQTYEVGTIVVNTKTATIAHGDNEFVVSANSLYVREKPTKSSQAVDILRFNDEVAIIGKCEINGESKWCPISYIRPNEKIPRSGWVNFDFLE